LNKWRAFMPSSTAATNSRVLAWLQLLRVPNVFTAIADVSMGYLVADGGAQRPWLWFSLATISSCMYLAGMALNDVFDYHVDRRERPGRPLPSGRIERRSAAIVAASLLGAGIVLAWPLGLASRSAAPFQFSAGPLTLALGISILFYNGLFKATALGPLFMGGCRFVNVLLGMGVTQEPRLFQSPAPWIVAMGIGLYVTGITWFARYEAVESPRRGLLAGLALMLVGVTLLNTLALDGTLPHSRVRVTFTREWVWPMLLWLSTVPVWRHSLLAILDPQPAKVQAVIKQALFALIVLDAAVALIVAGPLYALGIFALMIPAALLGRLVYVT
jgi:4-hydroxybenzoate polyprenyltransferase